MWYFHLRLIGATQRKPLVLCKQLICEIIPAQQNSVLIAALNSDLSTWKVAHHLSCPVCPVSVLPWMKSASFPVPDAVWMSEAALGAARSAAAPGWQTLSLLWAGISHLQPLLRAATAPGRAGTPLCPLLRTGYTARDKSSGCWGREHAVLRRAPHKLVGFLQGGGPGWLTEQAHAWSQGTRMSVGMPPGSSAVGLMANFL